MRPVVRLTLALVAAAAPAAAKVDVSVLVRSGDAANDGLRVDAVAQPSSSATGLTFRAGTSLLVVGHDDTRSVVARTGDPLPAPFAGTWNGFVGLDVNGPGAVAVNASVNGVDASTVLFLLDGDTAVPVALDASGWPVLNDGGQIAYLGERTESLFLWSRADGRSVRIVAKGDPLLGGNAFAGVRGRPLLNASGAVAFSGVDEHHRQGVFLWEDTSLIQVAGERTGSGEVRVRFDRGDEIAVALNDRGDLAFIAGRSRVDHAVYVRSPDGAVVRVAGRHSPVGSEAIDDIDSTDLELDATGAATFTAKFRSRRSARLRAANGTLAVVPPPEQEAIPPATIHVGPSDPGFVATVLDTNASGTFAIGLRREGLYRLTDAGPVLLVAAGTTMADGRHLDSIVGPHATVGGALVFFGRDEQRRAFLGARRSDGTLRTLAAAGDLAPTGQPYGSLGFLLATQGDDALFLVFADHSGPGGIFRVNPQTGAVDTVLPFDALDEGRRVVSANSFAPVAHGIAFDGTLSTRERGIFVTGRGGLQRIVPVANTPRHGRISEVDDLVASDGHVVFSATVDGDSRTALLSWQDGELKRLAVEKRRAPGGGHFDALFPDLPIAVRRRRVAFLASVPQGEDSHVHLFLSGARGVRRVLADGAAVAGGLSARLGSDVAFSDRGIVVTASLRGGPASALLRVVP